MLENPYTPPSVDLDESSELQRSIWWKIYFFLITVLSFLGSYSYIVAENSGIPEYLSLFSLVIATVGLFGYCFLKQILFPKFWMVFLVLYFIYGIIYMFISEVDLRMGMSESEFHISIAIGYIMSLPGYFALFSYGRIKNPIWSKA
ncbi:hypothetical protein P3339_17270 [Microbulbifer sp. MLAF003]|uniref:hypothetical protein n=1 Tax=Microbulbifer sp. MLAF003 TaxID=3032582 RepID=UPI0024AD4214|nr:hypothetical protein [Microbulbifer sp. MLAF003]WHI50182.1 hypothetical protein P3339_17270 [Microbulbifer sp. MLAF003]